MKQCFIISPIGQENSETRKHADDVFEYIIKPAMETCEINAFRSDHLEKPGRISEQMFQAIYQSDLCIAVLTNYNPNVFYELAVAQSAQRPVIILIEKGQQLPFDISDLRCVYYDLEIRSYKEQTHIKTIINFVREFEAAAWKSPDFFGAFRPQPKPEIKELEFFESSGEYGKDSTWLDLIQGAKNSIDIMGVALSSWRKTRNFEKIAVQKAKDGCKIRILLMHQENPILKGLHYGDGLSYENGVQDIIRNFTYFNNLAKKSENIEIRQIHVGIPHFFLTGNEEYGVIILYLSSQLWGSGPLWKYTNQFKLYNVVKDEFEALWELNKTLPESDS